MAVQQRSVVLPVRALDGSATFVRVPAAASVRDLKAALHVCFSPAQSAPAFHLFLRGGKLLLDAKFASLSLARGEFVSLTPSLASPPRRQWRAPIQSFEPTC
jgi:DEAD/DEAH box helicase domain-containing protein